jgi:hypothetical protein
MGATSARGERPGGAPAGVRARWVVAVLVSWAALFGAAYALGSGISKSATTTTTTTITRSTPATSTLAPGSTPTTPKAPRPPAVKVKPIVPMPPAPALKPYRVAAVVHERPAQTSVRVAAAPAVPQATATVPPTTAGLASSQIGAGPGGMELASPSGGASVSTGSAAGG